MNRDILLNYKHINTEYSTQQTNTVVWTPAASSRFVITDLIVGVDSITDGSIIIFDETNATANYIFRQEVKPSTQGPHRFIEHYVVPFVSAAVNNSVKVTTTNGIVFRIQIHGYEI